jgi:hypothetical protein
MRLNALQLDFLARLGKSPDGQQLRTLILAEIAECNVLLRKLSGEALLREQGKAIYLDDLVSRLSQPASAPVSPKPFPRLSGELA